MINSNRIDFTNAKLNMLGNAKKLYTNKEAFRVNGRTYRLKLRVSKNAKTFCVWHDSRRISLGSLCKEYGVNEATYEAMQLVKGETPTNAPREKKLIFKDLAEKVLQAKEAKGLSYVQEQRRKFRAVPQSIQDKPIDKITREEVLDWKEEVLASDKDWNKAVEVPNNIWNVSADHYAFSLLEFRKNPFSKTKERKPRVEHPVPSFHQLKDIWKASNDYDHPLLGIMVKLKILTGMHFSEMEKILLEDVVNCGDWLEINHKIGIRHRIYLTPKVKELLEECIKFLDLSVSDSPLFTLDGVKPVSDRTINKHWNVMTRAMGMDFRFDRIRDSIVTEMKETGFESKYIVGHCYNENVQAKFYTDWKSEKMDQIFMEANKYWQERIYQAVNNHWF